MIITYAANSNAWIVPCGNDASASLHPAPTGFRWSESYGLWFTRNPDIADALRPQCSDRARRAVEAMRRVRTADGACGTRAATRVEDLFYAAYWSSWALVERVADGVESPVGEVPLRGTLELLARRFGRLMVERLGSWELHWLSDVSEIVDEADGSEPWVARWRVLSEAERADVNQRAFEIAVQSVLHGHSSEALAARGQPHRSGSQDPAERDAREEYAKLRAIERRYDYQMRHLGEAEEDGRGDRSKPAPDRSAVASTDRSQAQLRSGATIHYLYPLLHDHRWWKR